MATIPVEALNVTVSGLVQGVGFRPFVHRLAARYGLEGWIRNRAGDVEIGVEGPGPALNSFLQALEREAPVLARIAQVRAERADVAGLHEFVILASTDPAQERQPVSPDVALCDACEAELFNPLNRRFQYPFITCTNCGPRYTVIEALPYDRERTTMRAFVQCDQCLREYQDPKDRRFHSETNSCSGCGPRVWLANGAHGTRSIAAAAAQLLAGRIVAIRGLGGFHLVANAGDEAAVRRLRHRKQREAKPLAIMVRTLAQAHDVAVIGPREEALLLSSERPIVILQRRDHAVLAPSVSAGLNSVGLMLAYTPLHHMLLDYVRQPLVMTSGNRSDEPIATGNQEALQRLADIADEFLLHDREIVARYDDSVVRVAAGAPLMLRRARGYAPLPVRLPISSPRALLAVGPHLKNTFTLAHGHDAYVSQHIGDLDTLETLEHFHRALDTMRRLFRIEPEVVVRDLHPGYMSSQVAEELSLAHILAVQHHHAHISAVAAEHGETRRVLGVAFDGTGLGADGQVWGAEFMAADLCEYQRLGQLRYAPMPGGDLAARRPWRAALGYLSLEPAAAHAFKVAFEDVGSAELRIAQQQIDRCINAPLASSMGRLFDAAAAILGVRRISHYEGHAAMELESLAGRAAAPPLPFPMIEHDGAFVLDPLPLLIALGERRAAGAPIPELAATFHESVAAAVADLLRALREATGLDTVVLSGGVFQNARLLESTHERLEQQWFRVLIPRILPPNDGAISYGQAAIAAARLALDARASRGELLCV